jgi:Right handed beta helix region
LFDFALENAKVAIAQTLLRSAQMTQIVVRSNAEVLAAIAVAKPGDEIVFAAGKYDDIHFGSRRWAPPGIIFRPAEIGTVTVGTITCDGVAGLTIQDLDIDTRDMGIGFWMRGTNPERLIIRRCNIHGAIAGPDEVRQKRDIPGVSFGVNPVDCAMEDCEIHHIGGGANGIGGSGNRVVGNRIHNIKSDAIHFAPGSNTLIEGNSVRDIYAPSPLHLDGIQLTTSGLTQPSEGIVIRRNHLIRGNGTPFQSIFAGNESKLAYRGLVIEENLAAGGSYHGVFMQLAEGPVIRRNYIAGDAGSLNGKSVMGPWIKLVSSTDAVITDNFCVTSPILVQSTTKEMKNNRNVKIAPAEDFSAAEAWWTKMGYGGAHAQTLGANPQFHQFIAAIAIAGASLNTESTRRTALAQMMAQIAAL